jgi:hypothetical protein
MGEYSFSGSIAGQAPAAALGALSLLAGAGACANYGTHLSATPTAPGNRELSLAADVLVVDRGFGPQVLPNPELGLRQGIASDLDVGARANAGSLELNARWRVVESGRLDLAVVPGVSFGFVPVTNPDSGLFNASALGSVLGGVELGERTDLVIGARGVATYAFPLTAFRGDAHGAKMIYLPGGVLGVRFPVGVKSYLFPELNLLVPYDTERHEWGFPVFQGGLALQLE